MSHKSEPLEPIRSLFDTGGIYTVTNKTFNRKIAELYSSYSVILQHAPRPLHAGPYRPTARDHYKNKLT